MTANAETTTFPYDNRGNPTSITPPTGTATSLTYDRANRLTDHGRCRIRPYAYAYNDHANRVDPTEFWAFGLGPIEEAL
jgi:YD repeat-containing protein